MPGRRRDGTGNGKIKVAVYLDPEDRILFDALARKPSHTRPSALKHLARTGALVDALILAGRLTSEDLQRMAGLGEDEEPPPVIGGSWQ